MNARGIPIPLAESARKPKSDPVPVFPSGYAGFGNLAGKLLGGFVAIYTSSEHSCFGTVRHPHIATAVAMRVLRHEFNVIP